MEEYTDKIKVTPELAYAIGCLRDGYIYKKQYCISLTQKDRAWLEYVQKIFTRSFGVNSSIRKFRNCFELRIFSKDISIFLNNKFQMPLGKGSWDTPIEIKNNVESWIPYISGYFDAEGYCTNPDTFTKTGKKKVSFHQNNRESLEFIKNALKEYGIASSKIYLQSGRKCYALYIQSESDIIKFHSVFKPIRKKDQLDRLISVLKTPKLVPSEMSLSSASPELSAW